MAHAEEAQDFIAEARLFYSAVACGQGGSLPPSFDAALVARHCKLQEEPVKRFRTRYLDRAAKFLAKVRPANLPNDVVYPFGGGDLVSALLTYPDATEFTTMSLEHAGDPTRLGTLDKKALGENLTLFRETVSGLLRNNDNATDAMKLMETGPLPGQLSFFLFALTVFDYEPVSLKYFRLGDDGSIDYLSQADIAALGGKRQRTRMDTDHALAFANMELGFRRRGDASAPLKIHRHIAANLADKQFKGSPLYKHLLAKGEVAAMTKAASYLLWNGAFSVIRQYLLDHMVFMISDSTGIPPRFAKKAGFQQITYGQFTGPYLNANPTLTPEFVELWTTQPKRGLSFRYGYPDAAGNYHLILTVPEKQRAKQEKARP